MPVRSILSRRVRQGPTAQLWRVPVLVGRQRLRPLVLADAPEEAVEKVQAIYTENPLWGERRFVVGDPVRVRRSVSYVAGVVHVEEHEVATT